MKRKKPLQYESSSDDDAPLASPAKSAAVPMPGATKATTLPTSSVNGLGKAKRNVSKAEVSDNDDDNYDDGESSPLKKPVANGRAKGKGRPKKRMKKEESPEAESEDDKPLVQLSSSPARGKRKAKVEESSSEDDKPIVKKAAKKAPAKKKVKKEEGEAASETPKAKRKSAKVKTEDANGSPKKGKSKKKAEEEEAEEIFKWWEAQDPEGDGSIKWQTLEHSGVIFPPPYEPLPKDVKMKYNGMSSLSSLCTDL